MQDDIVMVGSDKGTDFWTIRSQFTAKESRSFEADFGPKDGPKVSGMLTPGRVLSRAGVNYYFLVYHSRKKKVPEGTPAVGRSAV